MGFKHLLLPVHLERKQNNNMRYNKYNHSFIYIVLKNIRKSISKFNKNHQNNDLLYLQPHPTIYITHHKPHRGFAFDRAGLARETSLPCLKSLQQNNAIGVAFSSNNLIYLFSNPIQIRLIICNIRTL